MSKMWASDSKKQNTYTSQFINAIENWIDKNQDIVNIRQAEYTIHDILTIW